MRNPRLRIWLSALVLILLAAGCAAPQTPANTTSAGTAATSAPPAAAPATLAPVVSATTPAAPEAANPGAVPASGSSANTKYVIIPEQSEARYRVREQLANVSLPNDAIGKTKQISGTVMIKPDGSIDSANSKITVDVSSLQTDRSQRDNFVRRNVLHTSQYPQAVFVPKQVTGLSIPLPQSGNVKFQVTGDLTIQDVTRPVTWDVSGAMQGDGATGLATTTFKFEDFNLTQPRVPMVLSIEDHITLEVDVAIQKQP